RARPRPARDALAPDGPGPREADVPLQRPRFPADRRARPRGARDSGVTPLRAALVALLTVATSAPAVERPNVVLILADDLGWTDLGCYGTRYHETPRLDRLAAEGLRFTDFYTAAPVCSPTRAAIMSGQAPARLGVTA